MKQSDPTLTALLVEHIGDIEAAIAYVTASIDPLLWHAAARIVEDHAGRLGHRGAFDPDNQEPWFMSSNWSTQVSEADSDGDAWLCLSFNEAGPSDTKTSLAHFLGSGASGDGISLAFRQKLLRGRKWTSILAGQETVLQAIRDAGFQIEQREGRIELPVVLDPNELAMALADEDPGAAFGPLRRALEASAAVEQEFDKIVAAAREVTAR